MKLSDRLAQPAAEPAPSSRAAGRDAVAASRPAAEETSRRWFEERTRIRGIVIDELGPRLASDDSPSGTQLEDELTEIIDRVLAREDFKIPAAERTRFVRSVLSDVLGYGPLDLLLQDTGIDEVMCNDYDDIWVERAGKLEQTAVSFLDRGQYLQVIDRIVNAVGRRLDESSPMVDARLPDGSRVNVVIPPVSVHGASLTIRKFSEDPLTVDDLIEFGSMTPAVAELLQACVLGELNIVVSGGTGTGKTTLLNVLSGFIPADERIITIEDAAELQLQQPHVVTLESRPANTEGAGLITIRDLVRNALRMRPDRIVVGEVRGGEALDMLQAMNTGHDGSLTTVHANSPRDALTRMETLVLMSGVDLPERAIREQIVAAVDLIVQIKRMPDGRRRLVGVTEVQGLEGSAILLQDVFGYDQSTDELVPTGLRPKFLEVLKERGIDVPRRALTPPTPQPVAAARGGRRVRKG
ncbi:CpaF family protein [Nitriliruptoraceae bacterium ZYF776]|nr:CpaF family protein [Profundirhabdus halotolerans]